MNEKEEIFTRLKTVPMADLNVVERLAELEPRNIKQTESGLLAFNYLWYFPEEGVRSAITIGWWSEEQLVYLGAMSNITPKFEVELSFFPEGCNCLYRDITGREWPLEPEEFWQQLAFILDAAEDPSHI